MEDSHDATDRLAIVTGTTAGVGQALARRLLARGWRVVGLARRAAGIEHEAYRHVSVDLGHLADGAAALEAELAPLLTERAWARIALVNNAAKPGWLGQFEQIDPRELLASYAVNTVAPVWLMGLLVRRAPASSALRVVNVSSGAAAHPFPGLAAYSGTKAALRMTGMVAAAELASPLRRALARADVAILNYAPGAVNTDMQTLARSIGEDQFPWVGVFHAFADQNLLVSPDEPAADIAAFLESDGHQLFSERQYSAPER